MANQFNMEVALDMKAGQSTTIGLPNGQQVTVFGEGQMKFTFTSPAVNVIPMEQDVVEEVVVEQEVVEEVPVQAVEFRQWQAAQPGSYFYSMDTLANSGKQSSGQYSRIDCENLLLLKKMNVNTYNRIFERMNLPSREKTNLQSRIWRLEKPELVRASNQRQRQRYHRMRRNHLINSLNF